MSSAKHPALIRLFNTIRIGFLTPFKSITAVTARPLTTHHRVNNKLSVHAAMTKSILLSITLLASTTTSLTACHPQSENQDSAQETKANNNQDLPSVIIDADTVTISTRHILNIKSKRYQPSLGLKGITFPIDMTTLTSPTAVIVRQVTVNKNQRVKKEEALLTLQVLAADKPIKPKTPSPQNSNNQNSNNQNSNNQSFQTPSKSINSTKTPNSNVDEEATPDTKAPLNETAPTKTNAITTAIDTVTNTAERIVKDAEAAGQVLQPSQAESEGTDVPVAPHAGHSKDNNPSSTTSPYKVGQTITITAPFAGQVDQLYVKVGSRLRLDQPLLKLSDPNDLQFIGTLPIAAKPQLSVGQNVTFSVANNPKAFTGQVSQLKTAKNPNHLLVFVHVITKESGQTPIKPGMAVTGRIDHGQIQVGTIVPKAGIHDADLSALSKPPYRAQLPVKANVWIIGQDQRLTRQQVEVIEYDPDSEQYLVAGISNDSLICLAALPADSIGKKIIVS